MGFAGPPSGFALGWWSRIFLARTANSFLVVFVYGILTGFRLSPKHRELPSPEFVADIVT
jgi:hypothetical protein